MEPGFSLGDGFSRGGQHCGGDALAIAVWEAFMAWVDFPKRA